jgi:hypothetical protein
MNSIEECLDLVLQTLINNKGAICIYIGNEETEIFSELFNKLGLNMKEFMELLDILKKEGFIDYIKVEEMFQETNENYEFLKAHRFHPYLISISLSGKFLRLQEGYVGKKKNKILEDYRVKTITIWQLILTAILAFGTVSLVFVELLKWYFGD